MTNNDIDPDRYNAIRRIAILAQGEMEGYRFALELAQRQLNAAVAYRDLLVDPSANATSAEQEIAHCRENIEHITARMNEAAPRCTKATDLWRAVREARG
ncbi:hypothetical protein Thiowin_02422 [Thiorhodovibrio winogradskyi]|uniref:Uncharacterized protein n=1 Tax=Thiorhodovibrio winogradskyi TaxID=77007 RepID=A0ABZ0SAR5_9GAMM|nr:hypothetical protein [Thiorhodovibrio winogradskyi]